MLYTLRFFSLQNAVCFIMLTCLVPVLFTFYKQSVLKLKKNNSGTEGLSSISHLTLENLTQFLNFLLNFKQFLKTIKNYHLLATWHTLQLAADGGDSLQMWRVAADIFNKQWQTAKKGWLSIFGAGWQKTRMLHNIAAWFGFKWILWNDLSNGKWHIKLENTANRTGKA